MKTPGIAVNPIYQMTGLHDFNEVVFTDAFMPDDHVLGEVDGAWKQATSELAYERSGPERFLETFYVLIELAAFSGEKPECAWRRRAWAGWWRRCMRCGACRCPVAACCTPARSRC
jgi:alkylation response protein AidB-like acyl-CoA dehydrogenase